MHFCTIHALYVIYSSINSQNIEVIFLIFNFSLYYNDSNLKQRLKEAFLMVMKQLLEVFDILDDSAASGDRMKNYLLSINPSANVEVFPLTGPNGGTDVIRILIPGKSGKTAGKTGTYPWCYRQAWRPGSPAGHDRFCLRRGWRLHSSDRGRKGCWICRKKGGYSGRRCHHCHTHLSKCSYRTA